jgi:hypothetical protein
MTLLQHSSRNMKKRTKKGRGRNSILSVRLDDEQRRAIARVAKARKMTLSEVVRDAVDAMLTQAAASLRPYDGWKRVLGKAEGLPPDLSENTGRKFTELLLRRRHP